MELSKEELISLIAKEWPLYSWDFDEEKQEFVTDTEVVYSLCQVGEDQFQVMVVFYDGVEDEVVDENRIYSGTLAQVTQELVAETSANSSFRGYPMRWTEVYVEDETDAWQ